MKTTILIIHGAGDRSYQIMTQKWVPYLQKSLGSGFEIVAPEMPHPKFPMYSKWKATIQKTLLKIEGPVILIGHSLGGTILLKYLTEEAVLNPVVGLYLVASPYFSGERGWNYQDFFIHKDPGELLRQFPVYSYHSTDDQIVPVSHQGFYANRIPSAVVRTLSGHGHEYSKKEFLEIIEDIKQHQRLDVGHSYGETGEDRP